MTFRFYLCPMNLYKTLFLGLFLATGTIAHAQSPFDILFVDDEELKENPVLNETALDLVDVYLVDSAYKRRSERHRLFMVGAIIRIFGYRWQTIDRRRIKFIGTINKERIPGRDSDRFTEYDVNYDIYPHLPHYIDVALEGWQARLTTVKGRKAAPKDNRDNPPYVAPDSTTDLTKYRLHSELTPHVDSRDALNAFFYPTVAPMHLARHPNFLESKPSVGVYGNFVLDCNHRCHPEIHPYEVLWWLDVNRNQGQLDVHEKTWHVGLLRDVSNRFKHWSSSPRTGEIAIPFVFKMDKRANVIEWDHQVFNGFSNEGFATLEINDNLSYLDVTEQKHELLNGEYLTIRTNGSVLGGGIAYYLSDIATEERTDGRYVTGYLNIPMSVKDVYTAELRMRELRM